MPGFEPQTVENNALPTEPQPILITLYEGSLLL